MAAKDLQIIGKDVHLARSPDSVRNGLTVPTAAPERTADVDPTAFLKGVLRRQWLLLLLAAIASGSVAWVFSQYYSTVAVTAHLKLSSQPLPLATPDIYMVPNANVVSNMLRSSEVLQPVVEVNELPSVRFLAKQLSVNTDSRAGIVNVELTLPEEAPVVDILQNIGNSLTDHVVSHRNNQLTDHEDYVSGLLMAETTSLDNARQEYYTQMNNDLNSRQTRGDVQQFAEAQGLVSRRMELESTLQSAQRRLNRLERDISFRNNRERLVLNRAQRLVLEGRRRQIEGYGLQLTKATKGYAKKQELLKQLLQLEESLPVGKESTEPAVPEPTTAERNLEALPSIPVLAVVAKPTQAVDPAADAEMTHQVRPIQAFSDWFQQVLDVGWETVGDFDSTTLSIIETTRSELNDLERSIQAFEVEKSDLSSDIAYYENAIELMQEQIDQAPAANLALATSPVLMKLKAHLTRVEQSHSRLLGQLSRIRQVKECNLNEYVVSSPASSGPEDRKGNRLKLFVLSLMGSGLLFASPAVMLEWFRSRPTAANVLSRRWNLPVLGVQAANRPQRVSGGNDNAAETEHTLRLMALRIQQSLVQPHGRVVMFSGLDHAESPMRLIRELARCLSHREESVLIVQALPSQLDAAVQQNANSAGQERLGVAKKLTRSSERRNHGRPGVAEFLAGEYEEASKLVVGTGMIGVDFLPGGCTATASEAMASRRLTTLIDQCRDLYSIILLAGPSTLNPADLQMLAARADGIVFTVTPQSLNHVYGEEVIGDLIELGAPILGFAEQVALGKHAYPATTDEHDDWT
ncbi:MAG: hypothetical protein RIK87_04745 [Fuerstiella sp.]